MKFIKQYIPLHLLLMVYSLSGVFLKNASNASFFSPSFFLNYAAVILVLGIYAIGWQQVIKRMPLTSAYANRAVSVIWAAVWGFVFFKETIQPVQFIGIFLVMIGIVLFAFADQEKPNE